MRKDDTSRAVFGVFEVSYLGRERGIDARAVKAKHDRALDVDHGHATEVAMDFFEQLVARRFVGFDVFFDEVDTFAFKVLLGHAAVAAPGGAIDDDRILCG